MNNEYLFFVGIRSRRKGQRECPLILKVQIHEDVGVDDGEGRTDKDTEQIVTGETVVLLLGVGCFPYRHTGIALEDDTGEEGDDDAAVTELTEETAVTGVDSRGHRAEVRGMIIGRTAVYMVEDEPIGDEFAAFGDVGSLSSHKTFVMTKSISEIPVALFTSAVAALDVRRVGGIGVLYVAYPAGGIDGDTFGGGEVAVESDIVLAMGSDIAEEYAAVGEGVTDAVGVTVYIFACH